MNPEQSNEKTEMNELFITLKKRTHHLMFGLTIIALASLLTWWFFFIRDSIHLQQSIRVENLELKLDYYALSLGLEESVPPPVGVFERDDRFEVGICEAFGQGEGQRLFPLWPDLCIRVRPEVFESIEEESKSLNFMLIGESGLLVLIILITSIFLYRFIQLERRTTREIQKFWERSAHEIKTPITGIKAFLQNLKSQTYTLEELTPYVSMALTQVERQEQLAENLLSGYKLDAKRRGERLGDVELGLFLREYFERSALHLTDDVFHLDFKKEDFFHVRADAYGLRVILDNIVDNAMKYCSPGLELKIELRKEKNRAVVVLTDNGPGFSPEHRHNIFSAYRHLGSELPAGKRGTGIGLYISSQLARSMDGDLKAESEGKGQGSQFLLYLNLTKA